MTSWFRVAAVVLLASAPLTAQLRPQFELADVHASAPNPNPRVAPAMQGGVVREGLYRIQTATMVDLIKTAYDVEPDTVVGGPSWLELDRFDIEARVPASTSPEAARAMLQALLAERFALKLHPDMRPLPGLALTMGKARGAGLKAADGTGPRGCGFPEPQVIACRNVTLGAFVSHIRGLLAGLPFYGTGLLVDQTGLRGEWNIELRYGQVAGETLTLDEAMDRQLGLELTAARIPTSVLVVDSLNRMPTANAPGVVAMLPPPPPGAFEAAALRLSDPNAPDVRSPGPMPGGRFEVLNFPLKQLITLAWGLAGQDLVGAPDWLNSARVDLTAKLPVTGATREIQGVVDLNAFVPALKALLTDRFKVAIHSDRRLGPGYALVAGKPNLRKADPATRTKCFEGPGADGKDPRRSNRLLSRLVTCQNMTMAQFAEQLPRLSRGSIRSEVVDATRLTGAYDFTLSFSGPEVARAQAALDAAGQATAIDPGGSLTLAAALERQLGLKLEARQIPLPVVVLDHIEPKPADN